MEERDCLRACLHHLTKTHPDTDDWCSSPERSNPPTPIYLMPLWCSFYGNTSTEEDTKQEQGDQGQKPEDEAQLTAQTLGARQAGGTVP